MASENNIWILNHHAETPRTGSGTRHYDFAVELLKRGYKVTIFSSSHIHYTNTNLLKPEEKFKYCDIDGINWIYLNTISYEHNGIRRILGMFDYYIKVLYHSKKFDKPSVIIGSSVHLLACLAAYKISKRFKVKFISEIRDLWPETLIQMGKINRDGLMAKLLSALEYYIYKKSDKIIVTAPGMKDYISSKGFNTNKVVYINNGVDVKLFDNRLKSFRDIQTTIDKTNFNVIYTGGHGLVNDLDTAILAAKLIKDKGYHDICFSFFGDGPLKKDAILKAKNMNLNNVFFNNMIPKYHIPVILNQADCLIFMGKDSPLYKYGISANKLFEYLCSGKPIIFGMETINDFVSEAGCGFTIKPENPTAMASAILKIYSMTKEEQIKMGLRGRKFVEEHFDIPILVDLLEEVINS